MGKNSGFNRQQREILGAAAGAEEEELEQPNGTEGVDAGVTGESPVEQPVGEQAGEEAPVEQPQAEQADAVVAEPAPEVAVAVAEQAAPVVQDAEPVEADDEVKPARSFVAQQIFGNLEEYKLNMAAKKPVSLPKVLQYQLMLFRTIQMVFERSGDEFQAIFTEFLAFFESDKNGAFSPLRVFRGFDNIELSATDRIAFQRFLNMFQALSNPKARALGLKQVDLESSLQFGVSDLARRRILNYFHQ